MIQELLGIINNRAYYSLTPWLFVSQSERNGMFHKMPLRFITGSLSTWLVEQAFKLNMSFFNASASSGFLIEYTCLWY